MIHQEKNQKITKGFNFPEKGKLVDFLNFITKGLTPYLIIAAIILGVYFQTLSYGLINFDDDIIIKINLVNINNSSVIKEAFLRDAFYSHVFNYYRPIHTLSFIFNKVTTGENLFYFHLTNLLLHITFCCLLFYFLNLIKISTVLSLTFSIIFGVHPLFVNAVLWLVARSDLFVGIFLLCSFIMLIKYENKKNILYLFIHYLFFILGLLSKEIALIAPLIFIIYLTKFKFHSIIKKQNVIILSSWILLIISYLILRNNIIGGQGDFKLANFIYNLPFIPEILSKFFIPIHLSGLPTYNYLLVTFGLIIAFCLGLVLYKNHIKDNFFYLLFGLLWFMFFSIPGMFSKYLEIGGFDYLECRSYLPFIGIILFLVSILNPIFQKRSIYSYIFIFIILLFGINNLIYSRNYSEPIKFYDSVINNGTKVALAYYNRGTIKNGTNDIVGARMDYTRAIDLNPDYVEAYNNRGIIKKSQGDYKGALQDYNSAIKIKNDYSLAYNNRGEVKIDLQDFDSAIKDFNKAISLDSNYVNAYVSRGYVRMKLGDMLGAKADFFRAIEINPNAVSAYNYLGLCQLNSKEYKKVILYFEKALSKKP